MFYVQNSSCSVHFTNQVTFLIVIGQAKLDTFYTTVVIFTISETRIARDCIMQPLSSRAHKQLNLFSYFSFNRLLSAQQTHTKILGSTKEKTELQEGYFPRLRGILSIECCPKIVTITHKTQPLVIFVLMQKNNTIFRGQHPKIWTKL